MDYSAGLSCTLLIVSPDGWNQDWGGVSKSVKEANLKWHWPAKSDHFPLQKIKNFQGGPKGRKLNLIIPFDQPVLVADLLHHVGLPQAVAVAQPAITLVCSTIIIRAPFGIHGNSHDRCNQLITINLSSWFLICVDFDKYSNEALVPNLTTAPHWGLGRCSEAFRPPTASRSSGARRNRLPERIEWRWLQITLKYKD